uniref:Rha family transcriptional regulator n=1 Tax=Campylobacter fetus TaxID=196 RepID=UPI003AF7F167
MSSVVLINNQEVNFEVVGDQTYTTSLAISNVFEKQHQHIIAKIRELPQDEFNASNFRPVKYLDKKGEFRQMYNLTRDGFSLMVT